VDHTNHSNSSVTEEISLERKWDAVVEDPPPARRATQLPWVVLAVIALVYIGACFAPVIFDDNEGLYAGAVREMHVSGNWLMPTVNGFPRVQKPPLVYWTMLVSTSVLGENEFALRLPNALATVGWIFATYLMMRRIGDEQFGLGSAMILASMLGVWIFNHLVQPEPFLACFISLAAVARRPLSRGSLVFALLDFSGPGCAEQGIAWGALALGDGGAGGNFCADPAAVAEAGAEYKRHDGFHCAARAVVHLHVRPPAGISCGPLH
jgi:hypothetical protein